MWAISLVYPITVKMIGIRDISYNCRSKKEFVATLSNLQLAVNDTAYRIPWTGHELLFYEGVFWDV